MLLIQIAINQLGKSFAFGWAHQEYQPGERGDSAAGAYLNLATTENKLYKDLSQVGLEHEGRKTRWGTRFMNL